MNGINGAFQSIFSKIPTPEKEENRLFVTTTESNCEIVLAEAANYKVGAAKVALFTSGFFGLNLASTRGTQSSFDERVEYLLNVDNSKTLEYFWENIKPIIVSNGREGTIEKISEFIVKNHAKLYQNRKCSCKCPCSSFKIAQGAVHSLGMEIKKGLSWLSSDDKFGRIQTIFKANKFAFVRADLTDEKATEAIASALKTGNFSLDSIYLSNVREYTEYNKKLELFQKAMEKLKAVSTPETLVVDTKVRDLGNYCRDKQMQQLRTGFIVASLDEYFPPSLKSAYPIRKEMEIDVIRFLPGNVVFLDRDSLIDRDILFELQSSFSGGEGMVVMIQTLK